MLALLEDLKAEKWLSELNFQFAKFIDRKQQPYHYTQTQQNLAILLAALLSYHMMQGHTAMHLETALKNPFGLLANKSERDFLAEILQKIDQIPPLEWPKYLKDHIAFSDSPETIAPMLFQGELVYFYRYWQSENCVATYLQHAVSLPQESSSSDWAFERAVLEKLFPEKQPDINWQKVAVATALKNRFSVISGGPGTGKTTTVAKLLVALQEKQQHQQQPLFNIALVAPTGKAAARLKESLHKSLQQIETDIAIETSASTIHRLLGIRPQSDLPTYHQQNPLPIELLVVDEASMIDLTLMEKLMNALKPQARLILLGDKDQLASVEAGAIMGELGDFITQGYSQAHCDYLNAVTGEQLQSSGQASAISDSLCHLRKSYRFHEQSGIGHLAALVNAQQAVKSWEIFANSDFEDLACVEYPSVTDFPDKGQWQAYCRQLIIKKAVESYRAYLMLAAKRERDPKSVSISEIFSAFQRVRFLSALRVSEFGVESLNQGIAEALRQAKLVQFNHSRDRYHGKPILITQNSPMNQVYSGDIGLILYDEEKNLRVYFDTLQENGEHYSLSLSRVPDFEPAYVMTVHKSQGSEFEDVYFIMPLNFSPVVTKELIYTAITRAKSHFTLFSAQKTWIQGVKSAIERQSGLGAQLNRMIG